MSKKQLDERVLEHFRDGLQEQGDRVFEEYQSSEAWTVLATKALVATGKKIVPNGRPRAKGHAHLDKDWGRSEYLTLDVVVLPPSRSWGAPELIAEHENSPYADRVQYDAWKLLSVVAGIRILVAYHGGTRKTQTSDDLEKLVEVVARDNSDRGLVLISADYHATPADMKQLLDIYSARLVAG